MEQATQDRIQRIGRWAQKLGILYLAAMALIGWGFAMGAYQVWPYELIRELHEFDQGHKLGKKTTFMEKLANDFGIKPTRMLRNYPETAAANTRPIAIDGLTGRTDAPRVYVAPQQQDGYRAIFGAMDFTDKFWGGVLLDGQGNPVHRWKLSTAHLETASDHEQLSDLYGIHLERDGSVIFTQQERGGGIVKLDACSKPVWGLTGQYHHTITPTQDGHLWTFRGTQEAFDHELVKVDRETGKIVQVIDMGKVRKANPAVHIWNLQIDESAKDISHGNDIEPLPAHLASVFPGFEAGDLLLSYRTQNLVFVLDPDDLKVKWWRVGSWAKQHDPDWEADGRIHIFSNNSADTKVAMRGVSDIVAIDPQTYATHIEVDGSRYGFFSDIKGDHERSSYGTRMITSTNQGWAFEVDAAGQIVFSFINNHDSSQRQALILAKALRLDESQIQPKEFIQCTAQNT